MRYRMSLTVLWIAIFLSACSSKEKVDNKIEKKNVVEEVVQKQIAKAEKKGEEEKRQDEMSVVEGEKKVEEDKIEGEKVEEREGKEETTEKNEEKEEIKRQREENEQKSFTNSKEKKKEGKKTEEAIVDEQVNKLLEQEISDSLQNDNPDYNPTDENLNPSGNNNFVSQFGEDEFDKMINEARNIKKKGDYDYDLTEMKGDMVYATVFLMMTDPDSFIGKKFKIRGQYYAAFYEPSNAYYHYCFISDAAGCCQQGIEFAVDKKFKYPDDFPEDSKDILVTGTFEKYTEDDKIFVRLKNAVMKIEG